MKQITCPHGITPKRNCQACKKQAKKEYRLRNKNKIRELKHASYLRNREHVLDHVKSYRQANLEARREYDRQQYQKTKPQRKMYIESKREHIRAYDRDRQRRPMRVAWRRIYGRLQNHLRRTRYNTLTATEWKSRLEEFNYKCAYCLQGVNNLEMEHMVPVTEGGKTEMNNIVPSCPTCNRKKSNKNLLEWVGGFRYATP
jgi:5-methylcytosine-specific restriction endonuclease McrA